MNAKKQFLAMAIHDPSILTLRHCTGDDIRRLAPLAGLSIKEARRAFNLCLFQRTSYLALSLNPEFEPQALIRERAQRKLEARTRKKLNQQSLQDLMNQPVENPSPYSIKVETVKNKSRLSRYSF